MTAANSTDDQASGTLLQRRRGGQASICLGATSSSPHATHHQSPPPSRSSRSGSEPLPWGSAAPSPATRPPSSSLVMDAPPFPTGTDTAAAPSTHAAAASSEASSDDHLPGRVLSETWPSRPGSPPNKEPLHQAPPTASTSTRPSSDGAGRLTSGTSASRHQLPLLPCTYPHLQHQQQPADPTWRPAPRPRSHMSDGSAPADHVAIHVPGSVSGGAGGPGAVHGLAPGAVHGVAASNVCTATPDLEVSQTHGASHEPHQGWASAASYATPQLQRDEAPSSTAAAHGTETRGGRLGNSLRQPLRAAGAAVAGWLGQPRSRPSSHPSQAALLGPTPPAAQQASEGGSGQDALLQPRAFPPAEAPSLDGQQEPFWSADRPGPGTNLRRCSSRRTNRLLLAAMRDKAIPTSVWEKVWTHYGYLKVQGVRGWLEFYEWTTMDGRARYPVIVTIIFSFTLACLFLFMAGQYESFHIVQAASAARREMLVARLDPGPESLYDWVAFWKTMFKPDPATSFNFNYLVMWGAKHSPLVAEGQWWRWFTCLLLHQHINHLLTNVLLFLEFAWSLEANYGGHRLGLVLVTSGLAAGFSSTLWEGRCQAVAGASGAVFGIVGMQLADVALNFESLFLPWLKLGVTLFVITLVAVLQSVLTPPGTTISTISHVAGGLMGLVMGMLIIPNLMDKRWSNLEKIATKLGFLEDLRSMVDKSLEGAKEEEEALAAAAAVAGAGSVTDAGAPGLAGPRWEPGAGAAAGDRGDVNGPEGAAMVQAREEGREALGPGGVRGGDELPAAAGKGPGGGALARGPWPDDADAGPSSTGGNNDNGGDEVMQHDNPLYSSGQWRGGRGGASPCESAAACPRGDGKSGHQGPGAVSKQAAVGSSSGDYGKGGAAVQAAAAVRPQSPGDAAPELDQGGRASGTAHPAVHAGASSPLQREGSFSPGQGEGRGSGGDGGAALAFEDEEPAAEATVVVREVVVVRSYWSKYWLLKAVVLTLCVIHLLLALVVQPVYIYSVFFPNLDCTASPPPPPRRMPPLPGGRVL